MTTRPKTICPTICCVKVAVVHMMDRMVPRHFIFSMHHISVDHNNNNKQDWSRRDNYQDGVIVK